MSIGKQLSTGESIMSCARYFNCPVENTLVKERPDKGPNCSHNDQLELMIWVRGFRWWWEWREF